MIATGFEFESLPSSDVLIQFLSDDGTMVNTQIITRECLARLPVVVHAFFLAVEKGSDEACNFLKSITAEEEQ